MLSKNCHYGICINNPKEQYYDLCFKKMHHNQLNYCIKCLTYFCNDNEKQILTEIENGNDNVMTFYGYYCYVIRNMANAKKYLEMAVDKKNIHAMIWLARVYWFTDHGLMIKYCEMAIFGFCSCNKTKNCTNNVELKHDDCSISGFCSCNKTKNCMNNVEIENLQCEKCAIENGCIDAVLALIGYYFEYDGDEYDDLIRKYALIGVQKKCAESMYYLGCYYQTKNYNRELLKKYYIMSINNGCTDVLNCSVLEQIDIIELYFSSSNKELILQQTPKNLIVKLHEIIDNFEIQLCESCFTETKCFPKESQYLCENCYL